MTYTENFFAFCQDVLNELYCLDTKGHSVVSHYRLSDYLIQDTRITYQVFFYERYYFIYLRAKETNDATSILSLKSEIINTLQDIRRDPLSVYDKRFVSACKSVLDILSSILYNKKEVGLQFLYKNKIFASSFVSPHNEMQESVSIFEDPKENVLSLSAVSFVDFINMLYNHPINDTISGFKTNLKKEELYERIAYDFYKRVFDNPWCNKIIDGIRKDGASSTYVDYNMFLHEIEKILAKESF